MTDSDPPPSKPTNPQNANSQGTERQNADPLPEPEISTAVPLTVDGKTLNRDAVGWATQPIINTDALQRGRGRNKRWEYWNISTPTHIIGLTVSHIDYAAVPEFWLYERATGKTWGQAETVLLPKRRHTTMAGTLEREGSKTATKNLNFEVSESADPNNPGTHLRASFRETADPQTADPQTTTITIEAFAALPPGHERLALVVPWSEKRFQYTVKDVARPAMGKITIRSQTKTETIEFGDDSWATLDHGRGRWPYNIKWNWGAGSGMSGGKKIGIQVGAKWTAGTGVSENAFFVDGKMFKVHGETVWTYDLSDWRRPWRVTGGGLDLTLTPFHNKQSNSNFLILAGKTDQCFGKWSGSFTAPSGDVYRFDDIDGFAEETHNRW